MPDEVYWDLVGERGGGRTRVLVEYLRRKGLRIVSEETIAFAKTQIKDLSVAWPERELIEPISQTLRRLEP